MAAGASKAPAPAPLSPEHAPGPSSAALHQNPRLHSGATGGEATAQGGEALAAAAVRGVGGDGGKAAAAQDVGGDDEGRVVEHGVGGGEVRAAAAQCGRGGGGDPRVTKETTGVAPPVGASESMADAVQASVAARALVHLLLAACGGCGDGLTSGKMGATGETAPALQQACKDFGLSGRGVRTGCMGEGQGRAAGNPNPNPNPNFGAPEESWTQQDAVAGAAISTTRTTLGTQQRSLPALTPASSPELVAAIAEALAEVMRAWDASLAPTGEAGGDPTARTCRAVAGEGGAPATGGVGAVCMVSDPAPAPPSSRGKLYVEALAPGSPRAAKKSFEEVGANFKEFSMCNDMPGVFYNAEEVKVLSDPYKFSLIGKFSGRRPPPQIVYQSFKGLGLSSPYNIRFLRAGHIFLHLTSKEDMARIWTRGVWRIGGSILRIFKWTPHFSYAAESSVVPVWVQFPDLPVHMFNKNCVYSMARIVGCPIKIDEATADGSRLFMARACVEIDLLKPRVEQFLIGIGDEHRLQRVVYERTPEYCQYCRHLGHAEVDCYVAGNKPRPEWHRDRVDPIPPGADLRERLNQRERDRKGKAVVVEDSEAHDFQRVGGRRTGQTWARKQQPSRMGQKSAQELHAQGNSFEVLKDIGEEEDAGDDVVGGAGDKEALEDYPQLGTEKDDGVGADEDRVSKTQRVEVEDRMPVQLGQCQTLWQTSLDSDQQDSVSVEGGEQQVGDQIPQCFGQGEQVSQTVQRSGIGAQQWNTDGAQGQGGASRGLQEAGLISGEEPRVLESSRELPEDDGLDRYSSSSADQGVSDDLGQKKPARRTQVTPEGSDDPDFQKTFVEYEETDTSFSSRGGRSLASVVSPPRERKAGMPKVLKAQRPRVEFEPRVTRSQASRQRRALFLRRHHHLSFLAVLEPMVDLDCRYMARRMGFEEFLHLELSSQMFPSSMIVTVVYAKCTRSERSLLWESLEELRPEGDRLWLVGGDFNVISSMEEHSAGVLARPGAMEDFNNFIMLAGLVDAGFVGDRYTWTNNRVWKRLDRVLLSSSWGSLDFTVRVEHLSRAASDHCPLLVEFPGFQRPRASFRFQRMWVRHRDFMQTVRLNWCLPSMAQGLQRLQMKLRRLKEHLKWWNMEVFGNIHDRVLQAEESMAAAEQAYDRDPTEQSRTHRSECQARLFRVLDMEEDFWKQRAAIRWMGEGERNTKFFHSTVQKKRTASRLFRIWEEGQCLDQPDGIRESGVRYFQELLTGETVDSTVVDTELIPSLVSAEDNLMLEGLPSAEEVKQVVWSMCQDSAAGPDGFSVAFYRACWEIVGEDVFQAVLDFFRGAELPRGMASTTIVLIPKVDSAQRWRDFRPISLCNVSYKIISKLMAQRMASVLGKVISPAQSGFVPGRLISDNILMAQELDHKLNYHIRGGNLILKLDMAKAYDRVQWGVLFRVMVAFGFSEAVIAFIRRCVTSSWFSVLVNGQLSGFFRSQRGLRQGDPISPFLFILAAELLSRGIEALFAAYPGMAYATGCDMRVSHLAYADDVVIFLNGSLDCVRRGKEFLDRYEAQSGQAINAAKSSFFPSRCISDRRRQQIAAITGFVLGVRPMLYLGVPIISGNKRTVHFAPILAKIQRKFQGWNLSRLSHGGRLMLIQSVLSSLPVYLLQVTQPPLEVLRKLEGVFASFFWSSVGHDRKVHWVAWRDICRPKQEGGLGVRRLSEVGAALSMKLWFRFREQCTQWARFLRRSYCGTVDPGVVTLRSNASPSWRRMIQTRAVAEGQIGWIIGQGHLSFWHDRWMERGPLSEWCTVQGPPDVRVDRFLAAGSWSQERLQRVLPSSVAEEVTEVHLRPEEEDVMVWRPTRDGRFTTRSAWEVYRTAHQREDVAIVTWSRLLLPTISVFIWRFFRRRLPVDEVLQQRGVCLVSRCQCCEAVESWEHLFYGSPVAGEVWGHFGHLFGVGSWRVLERWRAGTAWSSTGSVREIIPLLIFWFLWTARNDSKHRGLRPEGQKIIRQITQYLRVGMASGIIKPRHWRGDISAAQAMVIQVRIRTLHTISAVHWRRPDDGWFKLNTDGSSRGNPGESSYGAIVRDHSGQVVVARQGVLGEGSNIRAELMAILRGLELCVDRQLFPIWLESDSLVALHIIGSSGISWELREEILRIRRLVRQYGVRCTHIYREGNAAADFLANQAYQVEGERVMEGQEIGGLLLGICRMDRLGLPYIRSSCKPG
ncbi:hypothetical protein ZIOFF_075312 [Zingiber officinale]|uniref:Reverse transcriptase domain-containing protein n=1 Tax=Zingiber officinale TaxID=94328 RepID=A0A8J5B972_ZINOF|nr:hypothetical protein ZIOFF_075312 [Zingiber officinale]